MSVYVLVLLSAQQLNALFTASDSKRRVISLNSCTAQPTPATRWPSAFYLIARLIHLQLMLLTTNAFCAMPLTAAANLLANQPTKQPASKPKLTLSS